MSQKASNQTDEMRAVLIDAVEIEIAALNAAVRFWKEWAEETSKYIKNASDTLSAIQSKERDADDVLELIDASRESLRVMTELPRNAAEQLIRELDEWKKSRGREPQPPAPIRHTPSKKKKASPAATRRARVKP